MACYQVADCRLTSPRGYRGNRSNTDTDYVRVSTTSQHHAGKFRPGSPMLEDYVIIPNVAHAAVDDCLTAGQLSQTLMIFEDVSIHWCN